MLPNVRRLKPIEKRYVHALTICINYTDYLSNIANFNLKVLDDWTIITMESDERTRAFCRSKNIKTIFVDKTEVDGHKFNMSYILNYALDRVRFRDWVLFLDGDTIIPGIFNDFKIKEWDKSSMYGAKRHLIRRIEQLKSISYDPGIRKPNRHFQITGFFMLCHSSSPNFINGRFDVKRGIKHCDYIYANQWKNWIRVPFDVYHLGDCAKNWHGRVTPEFK